MGNCKGFLVTKKKFCKRNYKSTVYNFIGGRVLINTIYSPIPKFIRYSGTPVRFLTSYGGANFIGLRKNIIEEQNNDWVIDLREVINEENDEE